MFINFRLASASRQAQVSSKTSRSSGEERRVSYDACRRSHPSVPSDQQKSLIDEEDEAEKADDEDEEGSTVF